MNSLINTFARKVYRMEHRGKLLYDAVNKSGISTSEVARRAKKGRTTLQRWYDVPNLSVEKMFLIGKIIGHDFSQEIPEMQKMAKMYIESTTPHPSVAESVAEYKDMKKLLEECVEARTSLEKENYKLKDELLQLHRELKILVSKITPSNNNSHQPTPP